MPRSHGDPTAPGEPAAHPVSFVMLRLAGVLVAGCAVLGLAMVIPATREVIQRVDDAWLAGAGGEVSGPAHVLAGVLAVAGGTAMTIPLRLAVALWLGITARWRAMAIWATAVFGTEIVATAVKRAYARPRPVSSLEHATTWAFPSGHAVVAAVTTLTFALLVTAPGRRRVAMLGVAAVVSSAMAWSRTQLHAHWLSDVVAGLLLGATGALLAAVWRARTADGVRGTADGRGAPPVP